MFVAAREIHVCKSCVINIEDQYPTLGIKFNVIASAEVTDLNEQVVTFNNCAVKAAEKVAIGNADDLSAEQAVPGEPELK